MKVNVYHNDKLIQINTLILTNINDLCILYPQILQYLMLNSLSRIIVLFMHGSGQECIKKEGKGGRSVKRLRT